MARPVLCEQQPARDPEHLRAARVARYMYRAGSDGAGRGVKQHRSYLCWVGLSPYLYLALYSRSWIAALIYANGSVYHLTGIGRRWDILCNILLTTWVVWTRRESRPPAAVAVLMYIVNWATLRSDMVHTLGVQWPLYIGLLRFLRLW